MRFLYLFTFLYVFKVSPVCAETYIINLEKSNGEIGFIAKGNPSALKITGKADAGKRSVSGKILVVDGAAKKVLITFDLDKLKTGIKLRDRHMKEKYLELKKFPKAKLSFEEIELPGDFFSGERSLVELSKVKANFEVHGKTKTVSTVMKLRRNGDNVETDLSFQIKLSDFAIDVPSFMGVTMAEDVKVWARISVQMSKGI